MNSFNDLPEWPNSREDDDLHNVLTRNAREINEALFSMSLHGLEIAVDDMLANDDSPDEELDEAIERGIELGKRKAGLA